jgi:hypothetical protein
MTCTLSTKSRYSNGNHNGSELCKYIPIQL